MVHPIGLQVACEIIPNFYIFYIFDKKSSEFDIVFLYPGDASLLFRSVLSPVSRLINIS